jgi:Protein of unknown function (DUF3106)
MSARATTHFIAPILLILAFGATAQQPVAPPPPGSLGAGPPRAAPPAPGGKTSASAGPEWSSLSAGQKEALKPLAASWNGINELQKRKWLVLSRNFAAMSPGEQTTLHSRMKEWAALSPQQRSQARLNFGEARQRPADEKKAKWEAYQALSPEEKRKLAAGTSTKPAGAAPAVKPVPSQKLAQFPDARTTERKSTPGTAIPPQQVNRHTLLPRAPDTAPGRQP